MPLHDVLAFALLALPVGYACALAVRHKRPEGRVIQFRNQGEPPRAA